MEKFDSNTERLFNKFNSLYPDLVRKSTEIFIQSYSKFTKYLSIQCEITSDEIDFPADLTLENDEFVLIKLVLNEFYKHISKKSFSEYQNILRKSILKKKNNLKLKVINDEFKPKENNESKKIKEKDPYVYRKSVCLSWLSDNNELILSEFSFFNSLSLTIQIPYILTTIEYVFIDIIKEKETYELPETGLLSVFNQKITPSCSVNSKGLLDFYVDFQVEEGVYKRVYWAINLPPKEKVKDNSNKKNELVSYSENYSDYFKLIIPDYETQLISMHIYNMLNYDWCNKGYIEYSVNDIILKLNPKLNKPKLSSTERSEKSRLKSKILNTLNDMPSFRIADYTIDKRTGNINLNDSLKGAVIFSESVPLDSKNERIHTVLAYNAIEAWKGRKNTSVLKDDFERIKNPIAKQILFFLQGYRIESRKTNYSCNIPLSEFKKKFLSQMSDKSYVTNLYNALGDLKTSEILIKDYKKKDRSFDLDFLPLSDFELEQYNLK